MPFKNDFTQILAKLRSGQEGAEEALLPLVYNELRSLARHFMRDERKDHTWQTTALVHEAYIKMGGHDGEPFENRAEYMRVAARAMRRVLIDHARHKRSAKHGGGRRKVPIEQAEVILGEPSIDLIALDDALEQLTGLDPNLAQVVELRFFAGLTAEETAQVLDVSIRKVMYDWRMARAWLKQEMN